MKLDHVSIRTPDLDAVCDFFCEVLELRPGARPPFSFPGYWLYHDDTAIVHLIGSDGPEPQPSTGAVDHLAFKGDGERFDEIVERIAASGRPYRTQTVPGAGLRQVFVTGPHGVVVELNFPSAA
jgi:catechol 2,3-dioxygenase-like lactoylglutathione lyase family enzyme